MPKYYLQGRGPIDLSNGDFKAQGGEGAIYVKGGTAYKVYSNPARVIHPVKIQELSVLTAPNVIRPEVLLVGKHNQPAGYSMRYVTPTYSLCQAFPKSFRIRHNFSPAAALGLVRRLQNGVRTIHSCGILIVDLNEMNFLVSDDFGEIYFIDVDSYQTPSFAATALMESVRDRHAPSFSTGTDWFSFAVVSFQIFAGIHPYKGTYPPLQGVVEKDKRLDARMRGNISVLHPGVSVPAACLPFDVIPRAYLEWYRSVFEDGNRTEPPDSPVAAVTVASSAARHGNGAGQFEIAELMELDGDVVCVLNSFVVTTRGVYASGRRLCDAGADVRLAITPRNGHLVGARLSGNDLVLHDLTSNREITAAIEVEQITSYEGRLYGKEGSGLFQIEFLETAGTTVASLKRVGNVMKNATQVFEGVAVQNMLGAYYASFLSAPGVSYQTRLQELDEYQLIDARLCGNVLMVVGARNGRYDKLIFRFTPEFQRYDLRVIQDIQCTGINVTVLETGICLHMTENDELEVFAATPGASGLRVIADPAIDSDARLFHVGRQALFARGNRLYRFAMRQQQF